MSVSILFYSNYCSHCKQIINEINRTHNKSSIRFICIDSLEVRKKLPSNIKSVPCVILGGSNKMLIGSDILTWVNSQSNSQPNSQSNSSLLENNSNISNDISRNIPKTKNNEEIGPNAWHSCEMNSFSDAYSFIDIDTSTKGNGGTSMVHNFELLNGSPNNSKNIIGNSSMNMPGGSPSSPSMPVSYASPTQSVSNYDSYGAIQNSETQDFMNRKMEETINQRELDVPNIPTRI